MSDPVELVVREQPFEFAAAIVEGVDPSRDVSNADVCARLRDLVWEHGVVCVRLERPLDDGELRALVSMVGYLKDPVGIDVDGLPLRYSEEKQIIDSGFVLTDEIRDELGEVTVGGDAVRPGLFEFFHTDDSYVECPASVTVLHARQLPPSRGGATSFLDMRGAYELLPSSDSDRLVGLRAVHGYNNEGAFPPRRPATGLLERLATVSHPIVRAHPVSGWPALYFDLDRARHIEGMDVSEGRDLLQSLQDHAEQRAPRYDHWWLAHDVLIWDNASVQHRASGDFPVGEPRRFWRYMVDGPRPIAYSPT